MPPNVLPAATKLKTVPKLAAGTKSTTRELMLVSQASEANTTKKVTAMVPATVIILAMHREKGTSKAQPSITHIRPRVD